MTQKTLSPLVKLARLPFDFSNARYQRKAALSHPAQLSDLNLALANTNVFTTDNASLVSVIRVAGCRRYITADVHNDNIMRVDSVIREFVKAKDLEFAWSHHHDSNTELTAAIIDEALEPSRNVCRFQSFKNDTFFDEQRDILRDAIQKEETLLVIWTNKRKKSLNKENDIPELMGSEHQNTAGFQALQSLEDTHITRVEAIRKNMSSAGFLTDTLSNSEVAVMLAKKLDYASNEKFLPRLFGQIKTTSKFTQREEDVVFKLNTPRNIKRGIEGRDYNVVFPPRLGYQLWRRAPEYAQNGVKIGSLTYGTLMITMPPDTPVGFTVIIEEASRAKVPFRVSMKSSSNSTGMVAAKYTLANVLAVLPGSNKVLRDSITQMRDYSKKMGSTLSLQMCITTWAESEKELASQLERLSTVMQAWGAQTTVMSEDAILGLVATMPPYSQKMPSPASIGPSEEVLYLAPLSRPALPWSTGGLLFRANSGKLMPFQPMSEIQPHHVYLVSGEPGYGKSLVSQKILIALAEGQETLPYIAISDVGPGSKGTVDYLHNILPAHMKHLAAYYAMQNQKEYGINMLDTPAGMRFPPAESREFALEMLMLACAGNDGSYMPDADEVLADALDLAYKMTADTGPKAVPKRHQEAHLDDKFWQADIQPALDKLDIVVDENTIYWDLFDRLFEAGLYREAILVQRFAVPLVADVAKALNSSEITSIANRRSGDGPTLGDYLYQKLNRMMQDFPIVTVPTQLDLGEARVVAFNLEDVCLDGDSFPIVRKGTIFFGLTSRLQVNRFFWNKQRLNEIPAKYRAYHETVVDSIIRTKNMYFADEQQRFTSFPIAARIPEKIAAEGRKRAVGVMLSTQRPVEFTDRMIELSTARFMVGFTKTSIAGVVDRFKLDDVEEWLLSTKINMPGKNGSNMLVQFDTDRGSFSQFVNLRIGQKMLWALSTKLQSSQVRQALVDEFGYEAALGILKRLYPSGEVESEYERRKLQMEQTERANSGIEKLDARKVSTSEIIESIINDAVSKGKEYFLESLDESYH